MTRYLISFDDDAMTFSEEEMPDVADACPTRTSDRSPPCVRCGSRHVPR